jgi:hypothetical protein
MGFSYRQTIGELIYALTVCRIDISIAVITLSQHSHHPAQIHYEAVKQVFAYLNARRVPSRTDVFITCRGGARYLVIAQNSCLKY